MLVVSLEDLTIFKDLIWTYLDKMTLSSPTINCYVNNDPVCRNKDKVAIKTTAFRQLFSACGHYFALYYNYIRYLGLLETSLLDEKNFLHLTHVLQHYRKVLKCIFVLFFRSYVTSAPCHNNLVRGWMSAEDHGMSA